MYWAVTCDIVTNLLSEDISHIFASKVNDHSLSNSKRILAMSLEGKVGVVTGGARGIGSAIAEALLQKGAKVCIADINATGENTVARFNEKYGKGKAIFVKCDLTAKTAFEDLFDKVKSEIGLPDIFCNNAGFADEEKAELMIEVNLIALMRGTKMAMHRMSKGNHGNGGVIINIASLYGTLCNELIPVYTATKHAVVGLTRSLAMAKDSNEKNGIKLVTLCPSFVDTEMVADLINRRPVEQIAPLREIIEQNEGFMSTDECAAASMTLLNDDVESGSTLIVGKVRGRYFHKFDDMWAVNQ